MEQLSEVQKNENLSVQVAARVKPTTKQRLKKLSAEEGKRMSDTVREIIESYVEDLKNVENHH